MKSLKESIKEQSDQMKQEQIKSQSEVLSQHLQSFKKDIKSTMQTELKGIVSSIEDERIETTRVIVILGAIALILGLTLGATIMYFVMK